MLSNVTRRRLIQIWLAVTICTAAIGLAAGAAPALTTAGILVALALVPVGMVMLLWPGAQPATAGEVLRGER